MKALLFIFLAILIGACGTSAYELAYISDQDGNMDICLIDTGDGKVTNLTNTNVTAYNLTWSASGAFIYYTSYEESFRRINRINVSTREVQTLLQDTTVMSVSDVSKDETKLLVSATDHHQKGELYLYDLKTKQKLRLTNNELYEAGAKFSPTETSIVASIQTKAGDSINHSGISEIFLIEISTLETTQLTSLGGFNALPDFSPDGLMVAFHRCEDGNCDVYLMKADGTERSNLTKEADDNRWPRWSPDGRWIAFTKTIGDNSDIYFISPDGESIKPVIATEYRDEIAEFRPENP